jgi:hypothetical protein
MWKSKYKERFTSSDGRAEEFHILQGPTEPRHLGMYYVGPVWENFGMSWSPKFNNAKFYYSTQDDALSAFIAMKDSLQ